ncbi:hypothetical protein [Paenibacillus alba]|uniref:Uncharacterized protein n=1 Tax=Paenibacillus alba TaxID=1197127 RepID=A0ABU6GDD4_9BACL|nr:hypothetical protein [Paenibacillus alba]MEC0231252.1 hypothetical protein [Paenibacillus alba]
MITSDYLKERFKTWSDDDLHDRNRKIKKFGGNEAEQTMIELESRRRDQENAARSSSPEDTAQASIFDYLMG